MLAAVAIACVCSAVTEARVTRIEIAKVERVDPPSSSAHELQHTVKDPLVLGIGFAATRDLNAFFRYEKKDDAGTPNP